MKLARKLRKEMGPAEAKLWWALRQRPGGYRFRKQCPQGPFSLDFACLSARLAIEVDGDAHDRAGAPERDARRDAHLKELGFTMMHIPAGEVFRNLEGVVIGIVEQCRALGPLHHASPPGCFAAGSGSRHAPGMPTRLHPPPRSGEDSL